MSDNVIRVAAGLRLGVPLCQPHHCNNCGAHVDTLGTYGLSCRFSRGCQPRHASLNDIIKWTLEVAKVPCHLEPSGLLRSDGKRPDGTTLVLWQCGKVLVWDATCPHTLAPSHSALATGEAGAVAADAEHKKKQSTCTCYHPIILSQSLWRLWGYSGRMLTACSKTLHDV